MPTVNTAAGTVGKAYTIAWAAGAMGVGYLVPACAVKTMLTPSVPQRQAVSTTQVRHYLISSN